MTDERRHTMNEHCGRREPVAELESAAEMIETLPEFAGAIDCPGATSGESGLSFFGSSTAEIFQIHILEPYIVGVNGASIYAQTNNTNANYFTGVLVG